MDAHTLRVEFEGPIGRLTLDNPDKLNPLSTTCLNELVDAAATCDDHDEVKVVIISGAGRAFTAGADLAAFTGPADASARDGAEAGRRMIEAIEATKAVTIAAVHGHCVGGGCLLVAACDLRVAAESTRFSIPEVDLGIPLAWGGIPRLVREVGPAVTRDLVLSCRPFGAAEALALRFVNRVVADDDLGSVVTDLAETLVTKSTYALRSTLQAVDAAAEAMVPTGGTWNDADSLLHALHDPESREVARRYLEARGR